MRLTVLTPERKLLDRVEVESVTIPGSEGQIQILPDHAPMIGTMETGVFAFLAKGSPEQQGVISTGFFEVAGHQVTLMAETLELKQEIDLTRARAAQTKAETALQEADLDEHKFKKYQLKLQRALIRQQLGQ